MQKTLFSGLAATALLALTTVPPASAANSGVVVPVNGTVNNVPATVL